MKKLVRVAAILAAWGCGLGTGIESSPPSRAAPAGTGRRCGKAAAVAADGAVAKAGETPAAVTRPGGR